MTNFYLKVTFIAKNTLIIKAYFDKKKRERGRGGEGEGVNGKMLLFLIKNGLEWWFIYFFVYRSIELCLVS